MKCDPIQKSLDWCEGKNQYAGIRRRLYYTSRSNVISYPRLPLDENGRVTDSTLVDDFVLQECVVFQGIDIIPEKSQATSEAQGEYPSQTSLDKIVAVHPGVGPEASNAAAYCHNSDNVYVMQDVDGRARVIGIEDMWPVKSEVAQDFGQGPAGTASTTISITGTNRVPFPNYVGTLKTVDGDIPFSKN